MLRARPGLLASQDEDEQAPPGPWGPGLGPWPCCTLSRGGGMLTCAAPTAAPAAPSQLALARAASLRHPTWRLADPAPAQPPSPAFLLPGFEISPFYHQAPSLIIRGLGSAGGKHKGPRPVWLAGPWQPLLVLTPSQPPPRSPQHPGPAPPRPRAPPGSAPLSPGPAEFSGPPPTPRFLS